MGNNQYSEALEYCQKIITEKPDEFSIIKLLARCYKKLKYYKKAEKLYKKLLEQYPEDEFLYKEYIEIKSIDKSPEDIIKELEKILKVSYGNKNAHIRIYYGNILQKLERYNEAIFHYEMALNQLIDNIYITKQLGFCYMKINRPEKAIEIFENSFLKYPADYYIKTSLISLYKKTGVLKDFVKLVEEAIKLHPEEKILFGLKKKILKEIESKKYD
jgi:tetratricopeptide (TPR) repeat protein